MDKFTNWVKENGNIAYALFLLCIMLAMPIGFSVDGAIRDAKYAREAEVRKFEDRVSEAKSYCQITQDINVYQKPTEYQDCVKTYLKVNEPTQYNKRFLF